MSPRLIGAVLALVAAILIVVSMVSSALWAGHPSVDGREIEKKTVYIGLLGGQGCNTGGDGTCEDLSLDTTFTTVSFVQLGTSSLFALVALLLSLTAFKNAQSRKPISKIAIGIALLCVAVVLAQIVIGPQIRTNHEVTVPIGYGMFLFLGAIVTIVVGGLLAAKTDPPMSLRAARQPALPAGPPQAQLDVLALMKDEGPRPSTPPSPGGMLPGPAGPLGAGTAPAAPLFGGAPQLRPLYEQPGYGGGPPFAPPAPPAPSPFAPPPAFASPAPSPFAPPPAPSPFAPPPAPSPFVQPPPPFVAAQRPASVSSPPAPPLAPAPQRADTALDPAMPAPPAAPPPPAAARAKAASVAPPPRAKAPSIPPPAGKNGPAKKLPAPGFSLRNPTAVGVAAVPLGTDPGQRTVPAGPASLAHANAPKLPPGSPMQVFTGDAEPSEEVATRAVPKEPDLMVGRPVSVGDSTDAERKLPEAESTDVNARPIQEPEPVDGAIDGALATDDGEEVATTFRGSSTSPATAPAPAPRLPTDDGEEAATVARPKQEPEDITTDLSQARASAKSMPKIPITTASESLPPPKEEKTAHGGPSPACPQCEAPMSWVEEHLRFYCKSCRMYF